LIAARVDEDGRATPKQCVVLTVLDHLNDDLLAFFAHLAQVLGVDARDEIGVDGPRLSTPGGCGNGEGRTLANALQKDAAHGLHLVRVKALDGGNHLLCSKLIRGAGHTRCALPLPRHCECMLPQLGDGTVCAEQRKKKV
jgi:hypothetical protein